MKSAYEEKLKFVTDFIQINSPGSMYDVDYTTLRQNVLPENKNFSHLPFEQVHEWLWLNDITMDKHKIIYDMFEKDEKLSVSFLNYVLTTEYFKEPVTEMEIK